MAETLRLEGCLPFFCFISNEIQEMELIEERGADPNREGKST